ncbi:MAG TPA: phytoene/squalene synthase family protein [Rhodanobacteraceae bacterium]|nr:phytoene/squalene synthase family protein [Rhodanobacteraceae bacterium]
MHRYARTSGRASYQDEILPRVSRTFALTIPQLPRALRRVVTNFYLLCRIADTIEDESSLSVAQKQYFHESFVDVVAGKGDADRFALELAPLLLKDALDSERDLVRHSGAVLEITRSFNPVQRAALDRCVRIMCEGMPRYERAASTAGLRDQRALDQYCYYVAGVVGETLTELFCDYSPAIAVHGQRMRTLGISFGQGLQMVNILKDFWEDHDRGVCWLPQNLFERAGVELHRVDSGQYKPGFGAAYARLISIAHGHLRNGFEYTLLIPEQETGIRRFCLLALGLAVQTLQLIHQRPGFTCGSEVKVSHRVVTNTLIMTHLFAGYDQVLRRWFMRLGRDLPMQPGEPWSPPRVAMN